MLRGSEPPQRWHEGCTGLWASARVRFEVSLELTSSHQATTGATSKRRSPWLCPAPSGGAGLFYRKHLNPSYSTIYRFHASHENAHFSTVFHRIPAHSLHASSWKSPRVLSRPVPIPCKKSVRRWVTGLARRGDEPHDDSLRPCLPSSWLLNRFGSWPPPARVRRKSPRTGTA